MGAFSPSVRALWPPSFYRSPLLCVKCRSQPRATDKLWCSACQSRLQQEHEEADYKFRPPDRIEDGLWLGCYESAKDEYNLLERGIGRVLIVAEWCERWFPDTFAYMQVPLEDSLRENVLPKLGKIIRFIEHGIANGEGVLVHCGAGISRSATVVIAYLMKKHGWTRDKTIEFVKAKRGCICPNKAFMDQLKELERETAAP